MPDDNVYLPLPGLLPEAAMTFCARSVPSRLATLFSWKPLTSSTFDEDTVMTSLNFERADAAARAKKPAARVSENQCASPITLPVAVTAHERPRSCQEAYRVIQKV